MSFDLHSTPTLMTSILPSSTSPSRSSSCSNSIQFNREPAPIHAALEVTILRIQNLAQVNEPTGLSTTRSSLSKEIEHSTEESQIPEIVDKFSLPCNQSFLSSTQDSVESLATPQEADWDDEQIRALLASPRYLPEREASAERSEIYHSEREGLVSSSSKSLNFIGTGKPVAWLSTCLMFLRCTESVLSDANPANVAKSLLEGYRDHLLTQARSELMKQEHQVESPLTTIMTGFRNKLMLKDWN